MNQKEHVAVIGSGISGIVSALLLDQKYDVTLIEADTRLGGHTNTITVKDEVSKSVSVDTGFIVFNLKNYPLFTRFLSKLKVPYKSSDMSFGFHHVENKFWYSSDFPFGIFSIKKHFFSIKYWRFIFQINQFHKTVLKDLEADTIGSLSLGAYLDSLPFNSFLYESYALPVGAAIWSCPSTEILSFPAKSFFSFWKNHALLTLGKRPVWKTIIGGSNTYIDAFLKSFQGKVLKGSGLRSVTRLSNGCELVLENGAHILADKVVIATHADQALAVLNRPTVKEKEALGVWKYSKNIAYLHTDKRVMPPRRNAWASWLVQQQQSSDDSLHMTYYMNRLQSLDTKTDFFVTLNDTQSIAPEKLIKTIHYTHPIFDEKSIKSQHYLRELNSGPIYYCGSYFGYGFHEDGVCSAVDVCKKLGVTL